MFGTSPVQGNGERGTERKLQDDFLGCWTSLASSCKRRGHAKRRRRNYARLKSNTRK